MLGQFVWYGYDLPLATRAMEIKNAGFDATMIWWGDELAQRDGDKKEIVNIVRDSGLLIENMHVSYAQCNSFWSTLVKERRKVTDLHHQWLEDCAKFEIPMMVMHVTQGTSIREVSLSGMKCIEELVLRAESLDVKIAVENTRVNSVVINILEEILSKNLGFCYDSSHDRLYSPVQFEILRECGDRLLATHLSDNDGIEDRHWLPGDGVIDWSKLFEYFPREYKGAISLESFKGNDHVSANAFIKRAYEKAKWIESSLGR